MRFLFSLSAILCLLFLNGGTAVRAAEKSTISLAHIRLHGDLSEAPTTEDPIFGSAAENFQSKLDRILKAQRDKSIDGLLLHINGLEIGWGKLNELRQAIARFRQAGKKAYAYLESGDSKDYLLATACDEVCLPESGWLMLTGMRAEVSFYKDLLDKIGIKADMLQIGSYKGTGEVLTQNHMSPQFRERLESVLDDHFDKDLVDLLIQSRSKQHWTPDQVKKIIDEGPYTAKAASAAGLVDRVAYRDQFEQELKKDLNTERIKISKNYGQAKEEEIDLTNPFAIFKLLKPPKKSTTSGPTIAVIYATGLIVTGKGGEGLLSGETIGSTTMIEAIRQAEDDKNVKAIVLRVDSPGGSALASDLIWNELRRSKKPVIASMSDTAASGGYYISMAANKIFAEPGTLTGSIGVVGGKVVIGGLFDLVGLKTEVIARGANSGIFSTTTPFSESERKAITALMRDIYDQFVDKAIQGRARAGKKFEKEEFLKLAEGRIWTGRQAKANGLVDELGTLDDAISAAKVMAGMKKDAEVELLVLPRPKNFIDMLIESRSDARLLAQIGSAQQFQGLGAPQGPRTVDPGLHSILMAIPEVRRHVRSLAGFVELRSEPIWTILPCQVEVR
jgi:protease-4